MTVATGILRERVWGGTSTDTGIRVGVDFL